MKTLFLHLVSLWFVSTTAITSFAGEKKSLGSKPFTGSDKKWTIFSDFGLNSFSYSEGQDESQFIWFEFRPKAQYAVTQDFGLRGDVQVNLQTGRSQTRFQNPNFSFVNIMELVAYYDPATYFGFQAGAISQDNYGNPMFIADRAFPGFILSTGFANKKISITPKAQYSIPSSTSFESDRTEAEALPTLTTLGVEVLWTPRKWVKAKANIHWFEFNDLPSVVAFQSTRFGNSTIGTDPSETSFRYQFAGVTHAYAVDLQYSKMFDQTFKLAIVDNGKAPSDRRRSQSLGTGLGIEFETFKVMPTVSVFFAESDSVPAIYSAFELGRSNREGQSVGLGVELKNLGMTISAHYFDSKVIETRPLQRDMRIFNLALEFNDVSL